jgi:hypothetical protein
VTRSVTIARLILLGMALLLLGAAPAPPSKVQRLVLAPGCYVLAPGGFYDVSAYCLDQSLQAPAPGTTLTGVPEALGQTVIKSGNKVASLQTALERGLIRLEGLGGGDYFHVRVRNLSPDRLEICVTTPTVLMGDAGYPIADLKRAYPELAKLLTADGKAPGSSNEALEAHIRVQQQIWDKLAQLAPPEDATRDPLRSRGDRKNGVGDDDTCSGPPGTAVVCADPKQKP